MSIVQQSRVKKRLFALAVAGLGGTAAAAVSFAIAVYEAANPDPVPVVAAGEPVDTGRWIVTIQKAELGPVPPTGTKPFEPKRFLMIEFDLNNRSAATSNAFRGLLSIEEPSSDGVPEPTFYLARDKWIASAINPNMPERLIAVWEWPEAKPVPSELRLAIGSQIYKRRDNLYGASGWFDRDPAAVVRLPVDRDTAEAS
ncbi:hypothetical protein PYH37_001591 [Sinorhizobium numidicum]|uniref:DUF4352 domain-containing protein n=1 Tax=Sinorhizobium numidicum TaxID=680248 RepID=A0ABY8CQL3_9HYPH|nr:hypothetical protein [Sinorhizobium numidicum]WEX74202.1 hypothetical protein PYH37_001591 [Sinorhizobium numidicum]WEX80187.1 hypothetical protein PYH38_001592 [Sinorhizobium numidicum]